MELNIFYLCITLYYLDVIVGFGEGRLDAGVIEACNAIYDPKVLTTSCCPQIDELARQIRNCLPEEAKLTSCSEIYCLAREYDVLSIDYQIDMCKVKTLIMTLDMIDEETKKMNDLVKRYCVNGNYTSFPSEDSTCATWKYANCVFFSYNIACSNTISSGKCATMKQNIEKCRPYADEYVSMLSRYEHEITRCKTEYNYCVDKSYSYGDQYFDEV